MSNSDDAVWASHSDTSREHIRSLGVLGAQQTYPVVMAALDRFGCPKMDRLLRLLEILIVRYQFVGGGRTGALEMGCFAKVAHGIHERKILDATSAYKEFASVYPNDEKFRASLRDMRKAAASKTIYLLKGLQGRRCGEPRVNPSQGAEFDADLTVEHILPQSPADEWPADCPGRR